MLLNVAVEYNGLTKSEVVFAPLWLSSKYAHKATRHPENPASVTPFWAQGHQNCQALCNAHECIAWYFCNQVYCIRLYGFKSEHNIWGGIMYCKHLPKPFFHSMVTSCSPRLSILIWMHFNALQFQCHVNALNMLWRIFAPPDRIEPQKQAIRLNAWALLYPQGIH